MLSFLSFLGQRDIREILNSERSSSSNMLYMSIWYEIYLHLRQRCRKFWNVVNSGIEEAYTGRPYVSLGKTIDLRT